MTIVACSLFIIAGATMAQDGSVYIDGTKSQWQFNVPYGPDSGLLLLLFSNKFSGVPPNHANGVCALSQIIASLRAIAAR